MTEVGGEDGEVQVDCRGADQETRIRDAVANEAGLGIEAARHQTDLESKRNARQGAG